ncbi:MAG: polyphenol oxidase family protein [Spirochaetales bacterium]
MEYNTVVHYRRLPDDPDSASAWVLLDEGSRFFMTTKYAGDMGPAGQAAGHRDRVLFEAGYDYRRTLCVRQTHSRTVVDLRNETRMHSRIAEGGGPQADGILFDPMVQAAGVTVADCMPILLIPRAARDRSDGAGGSKIAPVRPKGTASVAAILHSGYRGTGIVTEAMRRLRSECGIAPSDLCAVLGPCIGGECYAVPAERAEEFGANFGENTVSSDGGESYIDLRAANLNLLEAAGVPEIIVIDDCTHCEPRLGSYRRDGAGFTRMFAIAGRRR